MSNKYLMPEEGNKSEKRPCKTFSRSDAEVQRLFSGTGSMHVLREFKTAGFRSAAGQRSRSRLVRHVYRSV